MISLVRHMFKPGLWSKRAVHLYMCNNNTDGVRGANRSIMYHHAGVVVVSGPAGSGRVR